MRWRTLLFLIVIVYGAFQHFYQRGITHQAGVLVADDPVQQNLNVADKLTINNYQITLLATFDIKARVLASKQYDLGRESDLSPIDFALGWGRMSDQAVLDQISVRQSNRFYSWHVDAFPIPRQEIEMHSANMHLIPENDHVAQTLKDVRAGQVVQLNGYLVEARASDGWHWKSSLTRNDTGSGACEVLLVKGVTVQ